MKLQAYLAVLVALLASHQTLAAVESSSFKEGGAYITEGKLDDVNWYELGKAVLTDYDNWDRWALKGIDGKDPVSVNYWEQFVSFSRSAPDVLQLTYNINLPWPFGSKNNKLKLKIDESRLAQGLLKMTLQDKQLGVDKAVIYVYAEDSLNYPGKKTVKFRLALTFSWFIEAILDVKGYTGHMQTVMSALAGNLEAYSTSSAAVERFEKTKGEEAERRM